MKLFNSRRDNDPVAARRAVRGLRLAADAHLRLRPSATWQIHCETGLVWLTRTGDLQDRVLREGESLELPAGEWLIGALRPAAIGLVSAHEVPVGDLPAWRALIAQLARRLLQFPPALALKS